MTRRMFLIFTALAMPAMAQLNPRFTKRKTEPQAVAMEIFGRLMVDKFGRIITVIK